MWITFVDKSFFQRKKSRKRVRKPVDNPVDNFADLSTTGLKISLSMIFEAKNCLKTES